MGADQALVLAAHGSHHDPRSAAPVHRHADRLRSRGSFGAVRPAFWKEQPSLAEVLGTVEADAVYVVPLLTSEGYFAERVFPRELGLVEASSADAGSIVYTEPVGTHGRLRDVVVDRVRTVTAGTVEAGDIAVALVGHGTERHERSADATASHADRLRADGRYAAVEAVFLDQAPSVASLPERFAVTDVVVVPVFVSNGHHVRRDIPEAIGLPADGDPFGGPTEVAGHRVWYAEAVGTAPSLTEVVLDRAAEAGADVGAADASAEPTRTGAETAFLAWLEADGGGGPGSDGGGQPWTRRWGELAITVAPGHDHPFVIRHAADRDRPRTALEPLRDPAAVRDRTGIDRWGNHRPLRTARTLPTGWRFETDDPDEAVRAVRAVYPASIDHWAAGRSGDLEVTNLEAVVGRQAGRYRDLTDVDPATLAGAIDACCDDCVRRRAWTAPAVAPDPSGGSVPCPEPCSFLLEALRSFAGRDPADAAVSANPAVPAAAFDRPANRYRARFERAVAGHHRPEGPTPDP